MRKEIILSVLLAIPSVSYSAIDCVFKPNTVKVGAYGAKESYLFACGYGGDVNYCFSLGLGTDDQAKNRYSTAMTALVSGKNLRLRFYAESTCLDARNNYRTPNSTWLSNY